MARDKAKSGVDGWLLVFILLMGIAAPIYFAVEFNMMLNGVRYGVETGVMPQSDGTLILSLSALLTIGSIVPLLWSAVLLWRKHRWGSVRFAIASAWLAFVGVKLVDILCGIAFAPHEWWTIVLLNLSLLIWHIVVACAATVYLTSSRRVANTYRRPDSIGETQQLFE